MTVSPASEGQIKFIRDLVASRDLSNYPAHKADIVRLFASGQYPLPRSSASAAIDELRELPKLAGPINENGRIAQEASTWMKGEPTAPATPTVDVPEGSYAIDGEDGTLKFYRVDRPTEGKWKGYTFVKAQASDDYYPIRGRVAREAVLAAIAEAGPEAASKRYGHELGSCGVCGRTLTDENSRAKGIGPICAGKMGW